MSVLEKRRVVGSVAEGAKEKIEEIIDPQYSEIRFVYGEHGGGAIVVGIHTCSKELFVYRFFEIGGKWVWSGDYQEAI